MTNNQLKYWELRWKQYYEYYYLEEQKRSNKAKEAETKRHNIATEKISKQELVLRRIELGQSQERINQEWARISIYDRSELINSAINTEKLFLAKQEFALQEKKTNQDIQESKARMEKIDKEIEKLASEIKKVLSSINVAEADAAMGITNAAREQDRKDAQLILDSYKNGWGEKVAYDLEMKLKENHTDVAKFLEKYGLTPPPQPESNLTKWDSKYENNGNNTNSEVNAVDKLNSYKQQGLNVGGLSNNQIQQYSKAYNDLYNKNVEIFGPDKSKYVQPSSGPGFTTATKSEATPSSPGFTSGTSSKSNVIISPSAEGKVFI